MALMIMFHARMHKRGACEKLCPLIELALIGQLRGHGGSVTMLEARKGLLSRRRFRIFQATLSLECPEAEA